jgi:voltage-gated potassium channel
LAHDVYYGTTAADADGGRKMSGVTEPPPSYEAQTYGRPAGGWRRRLFNVIFESDTPAGRRFDIALLTVVVASVIVVVLESERPLASRNAGLFRAFEWGFTLLFLAEYVARLSCVTRPLRYATSFFGLVDLASVLPMFVATFVPGMHVLIDIRVLRLVRAFRILKLTEYVREYSQLGAALYASRRKISVFLSVVAMVVVVLGTVMYVIEGPRHGFTSIPVSIYWAVTTMTTVGFGDLAPTTAAGRGVASIVMLLGWGILAVPTGIVTAEMTSRRLSAMDLFRNCPACGAAVFATDARFCHRCGTALGPNDRGAAG